MPLWKYLNESIKRNKKTMRLIAGIFCNIKKINDSLLLSPASRTIFIGNRAASISWRLFQYFPKEARVQYSKASFSQRGKRRFRSGWVGIVKKKSRLWGGTTGGRVGAANRTRTGDLRITNASLYQLSYCGFPYIQNEPRCSHRGSYSKKAATYSPTN